eukprot:m.343393 g.343393  ORF g.343393 m.343393 type:complete len:355 (-) comp22784_c0_seq1:38-1102(-)
MVAMCQLAFMSLVLLMLLQARQGDGQRILSENNHDLCNKIKTPGKSISSITFKIDCRDHSAGNFLARIYVVIAIAHITNTRDKLQFGCMMNRDDNSIVMRVANRHTRNSRPAIAPNVTLQNLCECRNYHSCANTLNHMLPTISEDLRIITKEAHPDITSESSHGVGIYLRCGDILKHKHHTEYGFMSIQGHVNLVNQAIKDGLIPKDNVVISIYMASKRCRDHDCPFVSVCQKFGDGFMDLLRKRLPQATIQMRNSGTVSQTYAEMINTKLLICNPSTFCIFPAMAAYGSVYVVDTPLYPFIQHIPKAKENFHVIHKPFLSAGLIATNGWTYDADKILAHLNKDVDDDDDDEFD